ncbi:hypothetical protein BDM02DRAFT_3193555 [Thelephora ganbajun]|uniref:Uncharacterized protein n=1 Tax=Thelephora ganbajun TaxID=370292 RepID=A0ACB6YXW1_THEGA|nr:hypothetical protein BDM02DRAFT_3193555 [Thelephora ganbajun]
MMCPSLLGRLFSVDMGALMIGAKYKGEYEERINKHRKYTERGAAPEGRWAAQALANEPSAPETINVLRGIHEQYEVQHGARILDGVLISAATLAHRYLTSRRPPNPAVGFVDKTCASVRVTRETAPEVIDKPQRHELELEVEVIPSSAIADVGGRLQPLRTTYEDKKHGDEINQNRLSILEQKKAAEDTEGTGSDAVTSEQITEIAVRWTPIPVTRLVSSGREKLLRLYGILAGGVVGQPEVVKAVANALRLSRNNLSKTLATPSFDSPDTMIRIVSSEYSKYHSISRLIGTPLGYAGQDSGGRLFFSTRFTLLVAGFRHQPYKPIGKARKDITTLFLQVLNDRRLTDGQGERSTSETVINMTSNLDAAYLNHVGDNSVKLQTKGLVMGTICGHFPPEFID